MMAIELHPQFLTKNGEKQFAVLSYQEFVAPIGIVETSTDKQPSTAS